MTHFFHSTNRTGPYFEGWYFKHQNPQGQTLALIPAFHIDREGRRTASLQIISKDQAWWLEYPASQLQISRQPFQVQIGQSSFDEQGIDLHIQQDGLSLQGALRYGSFTSLQSDIMGPFRFFAGMQCSHGIISMGHSLNGTLELNGERLDFSGGTGYIETDRGRSFPSKYLWTQCLWDGPEPGSLMLAIAMIPLPVGGFTGCICALLYGGQEYRLATYRSVRIETWSSSSTVIRQGKYRLETELLNERRRPFEPQWRAAWSAPFMRASARRCATASGMGAASCFSIRIPMPALSTPQQTDYPLTILTFCTVPCALIFCPYLWI